jgi:hypothetical protein
VNLFFLVFLTIFKKWELSSYRYWQRDKVDICLQRMIKWTENVTKTLEKGSNPSHCRNSSPNEGQTY